MSWNPITYISSLKKMVEKLELDNSCLRETVSKIMEEIAEALTGKNSVEAQLEESKKREEELIKKLEAVKSKLDEFSPSQSIIKSNKALRIELEAAKLAISNAKAHL